MDEELEVADLEKAAKRERFKCQVATVHITEPESGTNVTLEVPAYTRTAEEMRTRVVVQFFEMYLKYSDPESMSVSDFAFYLLTKAADEPREQ